MESLTGDGGPAQAVSPPWFARLSRRLGHRGVPDAIDCAIAAGCFAVFTLPVLLGAASRIGSPLAVAGFGVLAAAPLIVRRKWPIATVAAVAIVYMAATLAGVRFTPFVSNAGPNFVIAVFTAADRCDRGRSLTATVAAGLATWAVLPLGIHLHPGQGQDAVQLLAAIPAWVAGDMVRVRRSYRQRLEFEARRRDAEKEGRVRAEERLRLSRDVHDVVSHSLSTIAVRSGVARLLLDQQPEEARAALSAIETASRSALDDLRQLLRQIRDPATDDETAMPTLGDLPALVDRLRAERSRPLLPVHRAAASLQHGTGAVRLPHRAGGADERGEACPRGSRPGRGGTRPIRAHHHRHRRRTGPGAAGFPVSRARDRRHAGTGRDARRPGHRQARPDGGFAVVARLPAEGRRP